MTKKRPIRFGISKISRKFKALLPKRKESITSIISIICIIALTFIFFYFKPHNLAERLNYNNTFNIIFLSIAVLFGIISLFLERLDFKTKVIRIFQLSAGSLAIISTIFIFIDSSQLTQNSKREILGLENKLEYSQKDIITIADSLKKEQFVRDTTITALRIVLNKRSKELEEEKIKRIELEKDISPRTIPLGYFLKLAKYKNMKVSLESVNDIEALRLLNDLYRGFKFAGWEVSFDRLNSNVSDMFDGVKIESNTFGNTKVKIDEIDRSIADIFNKNNILFQSIMGNIRPTTSQNRLDSYSAIDIDKLIKSGLLKRIPPNLITISIGFKPAPQYIISREKISSINPSNEELKEFTINTVKEIYKYQKEFDSKSDSIQNLQWEKYSRINKVNRDSLAILSKYYQQMWISLYNTEKENYNYNFKEKVTWIINEYIKRSPEIKEIIKKHYSDSLLKWIIDTGGNRVTNIFYIILNHEYKITYQEFINICSS